MKLNRDDGIIQADLVDGMYVNECSFCGLRSGGNSPEIRFLDIDWAGIPPKNDEAYISLTIVTACLDNGCAQKLKKAVGATKLPKLVKSDR